NRGSAVRVLLLGRVKDVRGDAKKNLDILLRMISSKQSALSLEEISSAKQITHAGTPDIIVDAIFGTGFTGKVGGLHASAIRWMNSRQSFVGSVDIPSGVDASTGIVGNLAGKADLTITMGLAKVGHFVGQGRDHSGKVEVVDISIPKFILAQQKLQTFRVESGDVRELLPQRPTNAHKYSVGKVLVIAGSRNLTGAPVMTSLAAMRTGAGAVVLATPRSIHLPLIKKLTEVMITPLDETEDGTISLHAWEVLREKIEWADAVALGPGLGQNSETRSLVCKIVKETKCPLIIDADALGMIAGDIRLLTSRKGKTILTPHVGELKRLTKLKSEYIEMNRVEVARGQASGLNSVLVLKGSPTVTGTPEGQAYINSTGNPGMATAGSGDVLTGIISSLVAQGMKPDQAAYCGVFVHGSAGDIAAKQYGERSMMAMDILTNIPEALKAVEVSC
ncbi:MAG: NAD(P)H-hydrate dehydratase, partial [bacterium]